MATTDPRIGADLEGVPLGVIKRHREGPLARVVVENKGFEGLLNFTEEI